MNIRTFRNHIKEGTKSLFKNRRMSIASIVSVSTCIAMLIISLCIAVNLDSSLENLEKNFGVVVYLGESVTTDQVRELLEELNKIENISNITYTSKEDALEWAKEQWGEESIMLSGLDKDNPFPRSFELEIEGTKNQNSAIQSLERIQKEFEIKLLTEIEIDNIELEISLDVSSLENIDSVSEDTNYDQNSESFQKTLQENISSSIIEKINQPSYEYIGIEKISHSKKEADILHSLSTFVRITSILLILAFAIISVIIIFNTIKITVYVRREEINVMKYVGATNSFIRAPFIIEGIIIGLIGAITPSIICFFMYLEASKFINNAAYLNSIFTLKPALDLFLVITPFALTLGVLLGTIGSVNSIKKHLDV